MIQYIVKRDERAVPFKPEKNAGAVRKAFLASDQVKSDELCMDIAVQAIFTSATWTF